MRPEVQLKDIGECPAFPSVVTRRDSCKYPFGTLEVGKGFEVLNRHESSVKQALKKWQDRQENGKDMWFTVRKVGTVVRVRRDK